MTSTNHFRGRELSTNLRAPVSPRKKKRTALPIGNQPSTVGVTTSCDAVPYACPISEGLSFGAATQIVPGTWRRDRDVYLAVKIAIEIDFRPLAGSIAIRGYILCTGTWVQVAFLNIDDWDSLYPYDLLTQPMTIIDPNVTSMEVGINATA